MLKMIDILKRAACVVSLMVLVGCTANEKMAMDDSAVYSEGGLYGINFPQMTRVCGCEVENHDGHLVLSSLIDDRALIQTKEDFSPPFALHVKVKTDSTNIRLYYEVGRVIFNWEIEPDELRFHDPVDARLFPLSGEGELQTGQYHDIVWEIYPDGTRLMVDDREILRKARDYSNLNAPVGIGPAWGSVLTVESFTVEKLHGTLEEMN